MARPTSLGSVLEREARGAADARGAAEARELSLEEVLRSYEQPLNEEQAWAVCYQCCRTWHRHRAKGPDSILLHRDGTVTLRPDTRTCTADEEAPAAPAVQDSQVSLYTILLHRPYQSSHAPPTLISSSC
ncbi:protein spire homolog 2-like, partial [Clarias gariepinus]